MKQKRVSNNVVVFVLTTLCLVLILFGCESSTNDADTSSSLQVASVTASPSSITVGTPAVIEAVTTDGTNPLPNRTVTFSVDSTYGYCTPTTDTSDVNGVVATVFTPIKSGTAVITATVEGGGSNTVSVEVTSASQSGSGNIVIDASPTMLLADGVSTSSITITVRDAGGSLAPDSIVVVLTAGEKFDDIDGNGTFTAGVDTVIYDAIPNDNWDPVGVIASIAYVTGGSGQATASYTSGTDAITVYVRATVSSSGFDGYAEMTIQLTPDASIASISLFSSDVHMAVQQTGGIENATLYATGYDFNGNPVPEGLQIQFLITDGPSGVRLGNAGTGPYTGITNANGVATCPIASGTVSGTVRIRAYADTVLSNATLVMVHAGPPVNITVGAEECNLAYWEIIDERVRIVAVVSDAFNNPVADSTVVYFTCDEGSMKAHENPTENEEGVAGTWWISGYDDPSADGIVLVIAETAGGTVADTSDFINSWIPDTIWFVTAGNNPDNLETFPTSINADGKTTKFFYIEVRDVNGNYVLDETEIDLEAYYLTVASGVVQDGCVASRVRTFLTSVILDYDHSTDELAVPRQDDGIGAIETISANYESIENATMACSLLTGYAYRSNCILDVDKSSADYDERVYFSVEIKDRWGNPLGDHQLLASANNGATITNGGTKYTDPYGMANYSVNLPPLAGGATSVTVTVLDNDPRGGLSLTEVISINQ